MNESENAHYASVLIKMYDTVLPPSAELTPEIRLRIRLFQSQAVLPLQGLVDHCPPQGADIVYRIGEYLKEEGKYTDAERLILIAIKVISATSNDNELKRLKFESSLSDVQRRLGRLPEAASLLSNIVNNQKA